MNPLSKRLSFAALAVVVSACAAVTPRQDLVGAAAPPESATRTVTITPDTRHVDVVGGDVVRFAVGDKVFGWDFNVSPIVAVFALNQVAPPGMLDHQVLVYVTPDPRYYEPSQIPALSRLASE